MMDLTVGAAAGVLGSSVSHVLENEAGQKTQEDLLVEICETLHLLHEDLIKTPANDRDLHETVYIYQNNPFVIRYKNYLAVYILAPVASTFTVNVSGVGSFTWTPNTGTYTRWRFPEGSSIELLTPSQTYMAVDFLYSNELEN